MRPQPTPYAKLIHDDDEPNDAARTTQLDPPAVANEHLHQAIKHPDVQPNSEL